MIIQISSNITLYTDDYQIYSWLEDIKEQFEKKIYCNDICLWEEKLISLEQEQNILIVVLLPGQNFPVFDKDYSLKIGLLLTDNNIYDNNFDTSHKLDSIVFVRRNQKPMLDVIRNILEPVFFSVLVGLEYKDLQSFFTRGKVCRQITLDLEEDSIDMVSKQVKRFLIENTCFTNSAECMLINILGYERISLYELNMIADVIDEVFPEEYPVYLSANISDRYKKNHFRFDFLWGEKGTI